MHIRVHNYSNSYNLIKEVGEVIARIKSILINNKINTENVI